MNKQNFDNFQKILQLKRKSKGRLLGNNKYRIDSITTKRRISPHQADFTSVPPHHPKTAEGFTRLGLRAHISRSTLLLSEAPQMLSNTSRFARLAERASYFSPPHTPSLVLHLHEAKLFLPRSLHLPNVSIILFSLHVKDRSKSLPHPSTSQNLFRFI